MAELGLVLALVRRLGPALRTAVADIASAGPDLPLGLGQLMGGLSLVRALVRRLGPALRIAVADIASAGPGLPLGLIQPMAGLEVGVRGWASRLRLPPACG